MKRTLSVCLALGLNLIITVAPCISEDVNTTSTESSKYLGAVREFADNTDGVLYKDIQDSVFTDVNFLLPNKGVPDPFVMSDGSYVRTKEDWYKQRSYLKAMLAHYQYGHMPPKPKEVAIQDRESTTIYGGEAIWTRFDIVISREGKDLRIRAGMLRPNKEGQFPVIINNDEFLFHTAENPSPRYSLFWKENNQEAIEDFVRREAIKRGYIILKFIRSDVAPDEDGCKDKGVFILYPEYDWGAIAAWAWVYSIAIDILGREPFVDTEKIVAAGAARGGKAALCAGIYDERILITAIHASGEGGTGSWRFFDPKQAPEGLLRYKVFGGEYFWVPRLFLFTGREDRMPFDAHFAKALIAPRVLLNTCAREDYTTNPYGMYLTYLAAQPIYDLLGVRQNSLIYWRNGKDHVQNEEEWLVLFDVCDKVFFGKEINRTFNDNPFPGLYQFDFLVDLNSGGKTSLHWSAELGRLDLVEFLVAKGVDLNAKNNAGLTPLDIAIDRKYKDIAKLLIDKGADINTTDNRGRTPLHLVAQSGQKDIAELLINKGADINAKNNRGKRPLDIAIAYNNSDIIKLFISKGVKVNIHMAVIIDDIDTISKLLEQGIDINAKNSDGWTPLFLAVFSRHADVARFLIEKGADVNIGDKLGTTPLLYAREDPNLVKLLLDKGADVNAKDMFLKYTALHLASAEGRREVVESLISYGADVNAQNSAGQTPLHIAVEGGYLDVVQLLLSSGANINAKDRIGRTPLGLSQKSKHPEITELLRKYGAKEEGEEDKAPENTPAPKEDKEKDSNAVELKNPEAEDLSSKETQGPILPYL